MLDTIPHTLVTTWVVVGVWLFFSTKINGQRTGVPEIDDLTAINEILIHIIFCVSWPFVILWYWQQKKD